MEFKDYLRKEGVKTEAYRAKKKQNQKDYQMQIPSIIGTKKPIK
jgi:hypothetical protein